MPITWYIIRASGLTAVALLILVTLLGVGQVTGWTYRLWPPVKAWAIHKALSLALTGAVAVHVLTLLFDKVHPATILQLLVPFWLQYSNNTALVGMPFGPLAIGLGIVAVYLLATVVISSLYLIDRSSRLWHWLHYSSYILAGTVFIHVLYAGSDFKSGPARWLWIVTGLVILAGLAGRLWRAGTTRLK
jgi:hypothetical protein